MLWITQYSLNTIRTYIEDARVGNTLRVGSGNETILLCIVQHTGCCSMYTDQSISCLLATHDAEWAVAVQCLPPFKKILILGASGAKSIQLRYCQLTMGNSYFVYWPWITVTQYYWASICSAAVAISIV